MQIYAELSEKIQKEMAAAHVPGLAFALVEDGELAYAGGVGMRSAEEPAIGVTPETLFRVGSITKPLTALLVLRLVAAGKLDLDVPVVDYIPGLRFSQPDYAPLISLRRLLSHTAGLPSSYYPNGRRDPEALADYVKTYLANYPFIVPPNRAYAYSNPGFRLAGYVAEAVTGVFYADLMRQEVFLPLGMLHTTFDPAVAMTYPHALAHDWEGGSYRVRHHFGDNAGTYPSGGAISNVLDIARMMKMLLSESGDFLPVDLLRQMRTPHGKKFAGASYGLGLDLIGGKVGHDGLTASFGGRFQMDLVARRGLVILCNRVLSFWAALDRIFEGALGKNPEPAFEPVPEDGLYCGAERGLIQIRGGECWWNGRRASLALQVAGEYLMANDFPCQARPDLEVMPPPDDLWPYMGKFTGADELIFEQTAEGLRVWSLEYDYWSPCLYLNNGQWACDFGTLTFSDLQGGQFQTVLLGVTYPLERTA